MSYWLTDSVRRRNRGSLRSTGQKHRIVVSVCVTSAEAAAAATARHRLYAEDENTDEYRSILHSRSLFRAARRGVSFPCMQVHCHSLYEVVVVGHAAATAAMYDMQAHNKNQLHTLYQWYTHRRHSIKLFRPRALIVDECTIWHGDGGCVPLLLPSTYVV